MRKQIATLVSELSTLAGKVEDIREQIAEMQSDEQEKFDNLTKGLQASERGQAIEAAAENLQSAYDAAYSAVDNINECVGYLESAAE